MNKTKKVIITIITILLLIVIFSIIYFYFSLHINKNLCNGDCSSFDEICECNYYYDNGQLRYHWYYRFWKDDWKWEFYQRNGAYERIENYKDWIPNGEWSRYYDNNQLWEQTFIKNGVWAWEFYAYDSKWNLTEKRILTDFNNLEWEYYIYDKNWEIVSQWLLKVIEKIDSSSHEIRPEQRSYYDKNNNKVEWKLVYKDWRAVHSRDWEYN